jgi:hypothetical protein
MKALRGKVILKYDTWTLDQEKVGSVYTSVVNTMNPKDEIPSTAVVVSSGVDWLKEGDMVVVSYIVATFNQYCLDVENKIFVSITPEKHIYAILTDANTVKPVPYYSIIEPEDGMMEQIDIGGHLTAVRRKGSLIVSLKNTSNRVGRVIESTVLQKDKKVIFDSEVGNTPDINGKDQKTAFLQKYFFAINYQEYADGSVSQDIIAEINDI